MKEEKITLGGGCFWCLEAVYTHTKGILHSRSGYMGGKSDHPTYEAVCSGITGHAEVVELTFDPSVLSLEKILDIFFTIHDPTTLNRQGNDVGTQYRSVIFYQGPSQQPLIQQALAKAAMLYADPIVTEICEATSFYEAEKYHQDYFKNNPDQGYCRLVVAPKVQKFKKLYKDLLT